MADGSAPFSFLVDLARRSRAHAAGLPAQLNLKRQWSGVGFRLAGHHFISPMGQVSEMLEVPSVTRLPGVQGWVRGVANVRGRLLPLVDLEAFFDGTLSSQRKLHRVLVLESGGFYVGLIVSAVHGMQHFPEDDYDADRALDDPRFQSFVRGCFCNEDRPWFVFDVHALVSDPRFANAAA